MQTSATQSTALRLCCSCRQEKPIDEFRRRYKGNDRHRHTDCRDCYRDYNRRRRAQKRSSSLKDFARCVAKADRLSQVAGLATAMIRRSGGIEGFTQHWFDSLQSSTPGSRASLSTFKAILNLLRLYQAEMPQPQDPQTMTDAEIDAELEEIVERVLAKQGLFD